MQEQVDAGDMPAGSEESPEFPQTDRVAESQGQGLDEVHVLRQELEEAQRVGQEHQDKFLRTRAEMDNYKKRVERTYAELSKASKKELLIKLLNVKDNLERALQYEENAEQSGEGIMEGVRLTQYQLEQVLTNEGVKPIEAQGKVFDPQFEEAIQSVPNGSVPDHTVVQVVRQGYTYQDEVLRPAQVIVSVNGE